jgi:hypothetical protein
MAVGVVWAVVLVFGIACRPHVAMAQDPDAATPAAAEISPAEPPPTAAAPPEVIETPTRRPTRPPVPTSSMTMAPTGTETTIAATPTEQPTARPRATATRPVPPVSTPTPTSVPLALPIAGNGALFFALGGVLALLAAWAGARIASARDRIDRRRARRTLATAMLLELRRIDAVLRRVVGLDNPASLPSLDHPIMEAALRDLTLFEITTAARIAQFHGALLGIQHEIGDYRDNPLRWAGRLGEFNQLIKIRAAAACRAVPELMKALERDGGAPPPHLGEPSPVASASTEALPPPPFGAGEGDDWTL